MGPSLRIEYCLISSKHDCLNEPFLTIQQPQLYSGVLDREVPQIEELSLELRQPPFCATNLDRRQQEADLNDISPSIYRKRFDLRRTYPLQLALEA